MSKKIVLTGGPGAGKTTIAEVLDKAFPQKLVIVPEAASIIFRGGFPRWDEIDSKKAIQRTVYHTQVQLENVYESHYPGKILILDRCTLDGAAYWPESQVSFFKEFNTTIESEYKKYETVIYLESAGEDLYNEGKYRNSLRRESWIEASQLDACNKEIWLKHPKIHLIKNRRIFSEKISEVLKIVEKTF